jgi:quinol monooxygenase YgiN
MFVVTVTFVLKPGTMAAFMPLMRRQAADSLERESACRQFDILTDAGRPDLVFLYEVYDDRAAFDAHLASAHFVSFDTAVRPMIADKQVSTWTRVAAEAAGGR